MNGIPHESKAGAPLSDAEHAELACAEFERGWRAGSGPRIEDWLDRVSPEERSLLFSELLEIELHARQQRGDLPEEEDYVKRFPEHQEVVAALFTKWVRKRLGDYEILREIGHGGMGVVYQAQHRLLNQVVAIKVLPESSLGDRQAIRRFQREMLSIGRLNHPNIIRALNAGQDRGVHYLVMEYGDGLDFRELVGQFGWLSPGAACELIRQAAVGLQHIHEHSLVHRDIKPANLLLSRDASVKILDLGLARVETRQMSRDLTHPGIAMGTVDYMAPEQWVDSSAVDIRADIYSLGCTLYFLLTGQPPNAMAMRESPAARRSDGLFIAPAVASLRRDCPQDLDKILELMLAEEPDERFDTPGEVADAIGVFANPAEVVPLASQCRRDAVDPEKAAAHSRVGASTRSAAARRLFFGAGSRSARTVRDRLGWSYEAIGGVAILLAVLAVWLAVQFWGRGPDAPSLSLSAGAEPSPAAAAELAALPGLNGRWWFDETPWLIPSVREYLAGGGAARSVADAPAGNRFRDADWLWEPNVRAVQESLVALIRPALDRLSPAPSALVAELLALSREDQGDESLAERLRGALERFEQAHAGADAWSAADFHSRAVLQHKIAMIGNDLDLAKKAAESYDAALAAYPPMGRVEAALRARCLVDAGQLHALLFKDYPEARRRFREARALPEIPVLLQAEAWLDEGIASAASNPNAADKYAEAGAALTRAQQLIQDAGPGLSNHPLLAHVHERYAWVLMDQWNVSKANQEFQEARNIRFDNYWKSKNEFAQIFVFHNDHGQAMAERYCGDERIARAKYDLVIGEVEKALAQTEAQPDHPGGQRFRRDLRERWSNSCERRADCELYGGAATGAAVDLKEAIRLYAVARDQADDPAARIAMSCKRAMTLALDGQVTEARQELGQTRVAQQVVIGVSEERVRLLRKLAEATLLVKNSQMEAGLTALRAFLKAFELDANYPDRHRRETQELQLFAAGLLIATQLNQDLPVAAVADLTFLDRLIAAFPYRDQMLPYLRQYYGLAIEVVAASDPERAAGYILASRDQRPTAEATMLLFHFAAARGRAIVYRADKAACYPLAFGRDSVKQAATGGPPVALPQELVDVVSADTAAGRNVVVYWTDSCCWSKAETALLKSDWPFGSQLAWDKLAEPATGTPPQDGS